MLCSARASGTRFTRLEPVAQDLVGALGDHARRVGVGGAAVGRVVLEAAVARRVVRRGDDDAVGQVAVAAAVERQDRVADRRRRRVAVGRIDHRHNVIGGQHLQRRRPGRLGQRVGVPADEQRPVVPCAARYSAMACVVARMCASLNARVQAGAAVPRRAEHHLLLEVVRIGLDRVVRRHHMGHIDEVFGLRRLPGAWVGRHGLDSAPCGSVRRPVPDGAKAVRRVLHGFWPSTGGAGRRLRRRGTGHRRARGPGNVRRPDPAHWPWPTFVVNIVGAFLLGYFTTRLAGTVAAVELPPPAARHRFLRWADDVLDHAGRDVKMLEHHHYGLAAGYTVASIIAGLLAVYLATALVRRVRIRA